MFDLKDLPQGSSVNNTGKLHSGRSSSNANGKDQAQPLSSRVLRQSDDSTMHNLMYQDLVYSQVSATDHGDQSLNFNIADSELTRSLLNQDKQQPHQMYDDYNSKFLTDSQHLPYNQDVDRSVASSSQFENALRTSQQMLEQAKMESQLMAEQLRQVSDEHRKDKNGATSQFFTGNRLDLNNMGHQKSPLKLPDLFPEQVRKNNMTQMLTSDPAALVEKKQMATLMMDTISSSEAESHQTSHFIGDHTRHHQASLQHLKKIDPDYMERVRAIATSNSTEFKVGEMPTSAGYSRANHNHLMGQQSQRDKNSGAQLLSETTDDLYGIRRVQQNQANQQLQSNSNTPEPDMFYLRSRPQADFQTLSMTNSTEFGQHSIGSSIDFRNQVQASAPLNLTSAQQATVKPPPGLQLAAQSSYLAMGNGSKDQSSMDTKPVKGASEVGLPSAQKAFLPQHSTILEDLQEEDISFAMSSSNQHTRAAHHHSLAMKASSAESIRDGSQGISSSSNLPQNRPRTGVSSNTNKESGAQSYNSRVQASGSFTVMPNTASLNETGESQITAGNASEGQGNSTKRLANSLSHQDDELIEELARTCFKSTGFYQPSKEDAQLPTADEVEAEERRRLGDHWKPTQYTKASQEPQPYGDQQNNQQNESQDALVTPDVASRRRNVNDLIKIDESQFVTLSQVQDNRAQMSSGRSPYQSESMRTDIDPHQAYSQASLSGMTQQRAQNRPPSSADMVSETYLSPPNEADNKFANRLPRDVSPNSASAVSNQLFQTQAEHTQGRLAQFSHTRVKELAGVGSGIEPQHDYLKRDMSQISVLEKRAQMLSLAATSEAHLTTAPDAASTLAQTQLEAQMTNNLASRALLTAVCQGCNQALVSQHPQQQLLNSYHRQLSPNRHPLQGSQSQASTQQVLCDDCVSRHLQSSDGGASLQSLRFSQLMARDNLGGMPTNQTGRDQNRGGAAVEESSTPRLTQFSSYQRFTRDQDIHTPSNQNVATMRFDPVTEPSKSALGYVSNIHHQNSISDKKSYLQQSSLQQSQHSATGNQQFLLGAAQNAVLMKSDCRFNDMDSIGVASSIDSRLGPSHLVWSQHKSQQSQAGVAPADKGPLDAEEMKGKPSHFMSTDDRGRVQSDSNQPLPDEMSTGDKKLQAVDYIASVLQTESKLSCARPPNTDTASSLQFLSYLSSTANNVAKEKQIETQYKYSNVNQLLASGSSAGVQSGVSIPGQHPQSVGGAPSIGGTSNTSQDYLTSNYKAALRNFMDKQLERSAKGTSYSTSGTSSQPLSRVFRERQSRRMFEDLQNLKGSCAKTYEELEQMHTEVLLGKSAPSRGV